MTVTCRVIPCLDVADGRVVKGVNFENLRDAGDPVELATRYYAEGADERTSPCWFLRTCEEAVFVTNRTSPKSTATGIRRMSSGWRC